MLFSAILAERNHKPAEGREFSLLPFLRLDFISEMDYNCILSIYYIQLFNFIMPIQNNFPCRATYEQLADTSEPFERVYQWRGGDCAAEAARDLGEAALKANKVAAVLLAGGMATRLGHKFPKGMYPIGFKNESLYEIFAQKLIRLKEIYGACVPLYIMTSDATDRQTQEFFIENHNFGLDESQVIFFKQGNMSAEDINTGEILYSQPGVEAVSPDGHGGVLAALKKFGLLENMRQRGIELVCTFQVDNPLIPLADPEFIGYCLYDKAEMGTMIVRKTNPMERVGNMVKHGNEVRVIEYSDLPESSAKRTDVKGNLALWMGNVAIHVFKLDFLQRVTSNVDFSLPFHQVKKIVPYLDKSGNLIQSTQPNAIKKERFLFDVIPLAQRVAIVEGNRDFCFSALKNAPGSEFDNEQTVRDAMEKCGFKNEK